MLEGLPAFVDYAIVMAQRQPHRDALAVVLYDLTSHLVKAVQYALTHYLPVSLVAEHLQHSSLGSPYVKWATVTNSDFEAVDHYVQRLTEAVWQCYHRQVNIMGLPRELVTPQRLDGDATGKDAWLYFHGVKTSYASCVIDVAEPTLTCSVLDVENCIDADTGLFLNLWNCRRTPEVPPRPIVTSDTVSIANREEVIKLQRAGLDRLDALRSSHGRFAEWLREHYTIDDVTAYREDAINPLDRV